jgi:hypothetical protein
MAERGCLNLPPNQRHYPSGDKNSTHEQREAVETVLYLFHRRVALRNAEDDRCEQREHNCSRKVRQVDVHGFFPSAM